MDMFDSMRAFTRVVDSGGFAAAARDLGLGLTVHADELEPLGGAALAARLGRGEPLASARATARSSVAAALFSAVASSSRRRLSRSLASAAARPASAANRPAPAGASTWYPPGTIRPQL